MKEWPEGSYIFMKSTPRVPGDRPVMDIGHKYSSTKVLLFISTEGDGSNETVDPSLSCYPENYYNVSV